VAKKPTESSTPIVEPPPEWVYLTHPEVGDSPNPVERSSLRAWLSNGWTETDPPVIEDPPELKE
jgi:hypothetical protein